ncbi:carbohydrate ABC transporter permease [Alicyclobacillus shizuokensis]|uniref:carbohydrate ABC transporter permease n=1 Tax=Alicyclobacillus shizuokensis TaxID=392014 RepID=UPI0008314662|nr:sugar ABC transporter permease [Alicyclobacillus shizuokensis]MCL6626202.1 sugar ABC transporter permease [Alicyclobacillus shizuokensis]
MAVHQTLLSGTVRSPSRRANLLRNQRRAGYSMLLPMGIVIAAVTLFPILYSVWMSFNDVHLTTNGFALSFTGLANYRVLATSGVFWHSVWFTVYYAVVTVAVELMLGMLIALAINGVRRLKDVSLVIMLIPWSLITVISAQMWAYIYNGVYGVFNAILQALHLIGGPVTWLGTPGLAIVAMMVADIWKTTPFVVIVLLAGLQMIPDEYHEAAYIDGANRWHAFWRVTFPMLRGSIALAGLFRILQAFGVFDLPFVLTNGGPGTATESLAILGYETLFQNLHFGTGTAVAVSTVVMVLAVCLVFLSAFRSMVETEGA